MKKLIIIFIAASFLLGCGNGISEDKSSDVDNSPNSANGPQIQVIGIGENSDIQDTYEDSDLGITVSKSEYGESKVETDSGEPDVVNADGMSTDQIRAMINPSIVPDKQYNSSKRVVCWGDSLTQGTGGQGVSYPSVLEAMSGAKVINYGIYNDNAAAIAAREGGNPQHVEGLGTIPAEAVPVPLNIVSNDGEWLRWGNRGLAGINPCYIAGVEGTFSVEITDDGIIRYFTRNTPGDPVAVPDGEKFTTYAMKDKRSDDIVVIWSGSTDGKNVDNTAGGIDTIIKHQRAMLNDLNCSQYVVINFTAYHNIGDEIDEWNRRLEAEYKEHYLDVRSYLMTCGLDKAGISPTASDKEDISRGDIPGSLRSDDSHGNEQYYRIVGELVYNKLYNLGYLK